MLELHVVEDPVEGPAGSPDEGRETEDRGGGGTVFRLDELALDLEPSKSEAGDDEPPAGATLVLGRDPQCAVVLRGEGVAPRHAELRREAGAWWISDLGGGVELDGVAVLRAPLGPGDRLRLGTVELVVRGDRPETGAETGAVSGAPVELDPEAPLLHATLVRSLDDLDGKRRRLDQAYDNELFRRLLDLAGALVRATSVAEVGEEVLTAAFAAFPVDRGFFFLIDDEGEPVCEVARLGEQTEHRPGAELPVSRTLLRAVIDRRLAVVTGDARLDDRLAGGRSLVVHDIRSALCAPLGSISGSGSEVLGVLQLDTPSLAGVFRERDLDLLTAIADLAAAAVERIRLARLGLYHSPAVVEEVLRGGGARGRQLREADVTVLFADLVGFTAFAESSPPEEVVELLRGFFERAVSVVFHEGGTLDKFLGDGVLAFFGAPVAQTDHPRRAVAAATGLQKAMAAWNQEREAADLPTLGVRIALESGAVLVGEIGSEPRMEYTVLGATVNRAARLEESVAGAGEVVLGPEIRDRLGEGFAAEDLGEQRLRGLDEPVRIYRLPVG